MRNASEYIRRELMIRLVRAFDENVLTEELDRIPIRLRPTNAVASRCCVYHDRAVLKYRLMALLGIGCEDETDEVRPVSSYLDELPEGGAPLTVCAAGCSGCPDSKYIVNGNCRGCFARPCVYNCPRSAITVENRVSKIDYDKCIKCGKCMNVCPFQAIMKTTVPCEESCPVGAIRKNEFGTAEIDFSLCIFCGRCFNKCPFGAILERSQMFRVLKALRERPLVAMVAPSAQSQFPGSLEQLFEAIRWLGFTAVVEVAKGAEETIVNEAAELLEKNAAGLPVMTTSCCPAYVEFVRKHLPEFSGHVSHTPSPMIYTARTVRRKYPDAATVFIGPCIAKRHEAAQSGEVDYVLSFEEIGAMLAGRGIDVIAQEAEVLREPAIDIARKFAASGGVAAAVQAELSRKSPDFELKPQAVNGIDKKTKAILKAHAAGRLGANFVEVMACEGGCVKGPGAIRR